MDVDGQTDRQTDGYTQVYAREIVGGVVRPCVDVFEAVDDNEWQVSDGSADVMQWMREHQTISSQHSH